VDSFQTTLNDDDTKSNETIAVDDISESRTTENLTKLVDEYATEAIANVRPTLKDHFRQQSLPQLQNLIERYYQRLETLEFHIERHEQLTKAAQRLINLSFDDPDNRKITTKKS
jgi:ubiquinone/menaquinone biosynthesis C-methylase UbiE